MAAKFNRRRRAALAALFFAAEYLSTAALADASLPDLGDAAQAMVTPQDERRLGEQSMGQRLLAGLATSHPDFSFLAVPSPEINAFSLPGGFIGINTGLILAARSESELASVLAHEITHVTQHHMARQTLAGAHTQMMAMAALLTALVAAHSGNGQIASAPQVSAIFTRIYLLPAVINALPPGQ